jgi:plastocyanin
MQTAERLDSGAAAPENSSSPSWRELLVWLALALALTLVIGMVGLGEFIPPIAVFAGLFVGGGLMARRPRKAGPILVGLLSLAVVALNAPFIAETVSVPASTVDFLLATVSTVIAAAALIASIGALRARNVSGEGPKRVAVATAALVVLVAGVATVARITYKAPALAGGDITITVKGAEFAPTTFSAESGEISVFVRNRDSTLHTFTIEDLDVDLVIPGKTDAKVTFDAGPGVYEFICVPHEGMGMKGMLKVE